MGAPQVADEVLKERVDCFIAHQNNQVRTANALGLSRAALQQSLLSAARRGLLGTKPVLPGFAIKQTSTQLGPGGELQREWIQQTQEAGEIFEPPAGHSIKGVSALVGPDGRTIQQWIKTKEETQTDLIAAIKEEFSKYKGVAKLVKPPKETHSDLMQVYPICDPHIGMLSWAAEAALCRISDHRQQAPHSRFPQTGWKPLHSAHYPRSRNHSSPASGSWRL